MGGGGERMLGVRGEAGLVRADGPPTAVVPGSASGWRSTSSSQERGTSPPVAQEASTQTC